MEFQPGPSLLHRLHPLIKLAWLLWLTVTVFVVDAPGLILLAVLVALLALWSAGVAPWCIPGLRLWLTLGLTILLLHVLAGWGGGDMSAGLVAGLIAFGRLVAVILGSMLFVVTTEPFTLACALMRVGLPYRWGFALVTALRLVRVFRLESQHVYRAQLVRGLPYDTAGPWRWWLLLRRLCLPLLVSAMRTAHALSLSMEGRAFGMYPRRTYAREVSVGRRDGVAAALLVALVLAAGWHVWRG